MNSEIQRQRLLNQHIAAPVFDKPEDVVHHLAAVQAQDYAAARWSLGLRLRDAMDADIEQAFNDGAILRTHVLRPTWHFVTPADIRWLLALTADQVHATNGPMYRKLELDASMFKRCRTALTKAIEGGGPLVRNELRETLEKSGVATRGEFRMSYLLMNAELEGIVCSGPRRGKQFTYALLDERVPQTKTLSRDDALAELARRYFRGRGPARSHDFAKWSGLSMADAHSGLEAVRPELQRDVIDGEEYWFAEKRPAARNAAPVAYLLSIYDEYVSSYKGWKIIADDKIDRELVAMGNALQSIVVVNGRITGVWKRTLRKDAVELEIRILARLTGAETQALATAAQRYGDFIGLPVVTY